MRNADAIADWLASREITHAFGIIGGGNVILFDAIQAKGATQIVCCHHEQAAAMASAYHNRITGRLSSVCVCTTGAGSTNAITGVMAAWMDSIPLLVLSGNENSRYMEAMTRVHGVQGYDSALVARPMTKWAGRASLGHSIVKDLDFAYEVIMEGRQGPVWIDIPKDVSIADAI